MKRSLLIVLILAICSAMAFADEKDSGVKVYVGKDKVSLADSARMYKVLLDNTPTEPQFMLEPRFAVLGLDGKFYFSIGSRLRFTASYDWGCPVSCPIGMSISKLVPAVLDNKDLFQMSAGTSNIYFNIVGFPHSSNQIGLFISLGLDAESNNTYRVKVSQIYMCYRNFQCGYAKSLYNDPVASAYTIDDNGPCSSGTIKSVLINYQRAFGKHFSFGAGVEIPRVSFTQSIPEGMKIEDVKTAVTMVHQRMPDFPLYVQWRWEKVGHLRLSAVLRNITFYNYMTAKRTDVTGYGIKLTGTAKVGSWTFNGMIQGGSAIANYVNDNAGAGLDLVPCDEDGLLKPTKSIGAVASVQYNFTPKIFATAMYSYLQNDIPKYTCAATTSYNVHAKRGHSATVNLIWKISDLFSTGIEYVHAAKTNDLYGTLHNNRMYGMFMMNF